MKSARPLVLIPAAGFGVRAGRPEAKEMMERRAGDPLIRWPLQLAQEREWPVLVITRKEKLSLINYLEDFGKSYSQLAIQIIEPTRDWPHTLLRSEPHWLEWNLVLLPDVEFYPLTVLDEMAQQMRSPWQALWASHYQSDASTWGIIERVNSEAIAVCEKPKERAAGWAWGVYAFHKSAGAELLTAQSKSTVDHVRRKLELRGRGFQLATFHDLTR